MRELVTTRRQAVALMLAASTLAVAVRKAEPTEARTVEALEVTADSTMVTADKE
jgi:hypothetical protein